VTSTTLQFSKPWMTESHFSLISSEKALTQDMLSTIGLEMNMTKICICSHQLHSE